MIELNLSDLVSGPISDRKLILIVKLQEYFNFKLTFGDLSLWSSSCTYQVHFKKQPDFMNAISKCNDTKMFVGQNVLKTDILFLDRDTF